MADIAKIVELYEKLSASPLGMETPWKREANGGKPLLYGGRRGLLAYGAIATWDEFDLIVEVVNAIPMIVDILERHCPGHVASKHDSKRCGCCGVHIDSLRPDDDE